MAGSAASLSGLLIKRGEARPTAADIATEGQGRDMLAEAVKTVSLLQHGPSGSPTWPEREPPQRLHPLNVRVQLSLSEGLRIMAFATGWKMQGLVAKFIEDGLDGWNPEWRRDLPQKFRNE